jgi:hypothetical protein
VREHFDGYEKAAHQAKALRDRILLLANVRSDVGEDINQSLHHYAVVLAVRYLRERHKGIRIDNRDVHPEQTGGAEDPDIMGRVGRLQVCAEVTAHLKPQGYVDTRIRDALEKLERMRNCERYYFVTTSVMEKRASTKLRKLRADIHVERLETGFDSIVERGKRKGRA